MKLQKKYLAIIILLLASCSSSQQEKGKNGIYPSEDFPVAPALPLPAFGLGAGAGAKINSEANSEANNSDGVTYTSLKTLMTQNGRLLTIWALAKGNWLWAYGPSSSASFGGVRNWFIVPLNIRGNNIFKFVNGVTSSCIEAYKSGVIHTSCDDNKPAQDFDIIPATNGGVILKSLSENKCLRYDLITHTIYSGVYLTECAPAKTNTYDQIWYIGPPLTDTTPLP